MIFLVAGKGGWVLIIVVIVLSIIAIVKFSTYTNELQDMDDKIFGKEGNHKNNKS